MFLTPKIELTFEHQINMKNRLIYALISLMIVSLIGIISIQSIWISGAITVRENDFTAHVNDAMNKVNEDINADESKFIIREQFGGVDSLYRHLIFDDGKNSGHQQRRIIIDRSSGPDMNIEIRDNEIEFREQNIDPDGYLDNKETVDLLDETADRLDESRGRLEAEMDRVDAEMERFHDEANLTREWQQTIELRLSDLDSTLDTNVHMRDYRNARAHHITSMVEHFSLEKLLNGDLKNRISNKDLKKKLRKALNKEGIYSSFEFAVYNNEKKNYEDGFVSKGFDQDQEEQLYTKTLFPNDNFKEGRFELIIQSDSKGGYIWSGVKEMAILSGMFTILILLSFGYALYFIFKQKKISQIKTDFINNMTHELKTPLASIGLASSSIKHPQVIGKPDEIKKFTSIIDSEKDRMNSHIERVLDIATLDKGDLKLNISPTDLMLIIQSSIKNVQLTINEIKGACSFKCDLDSAPLMADEFHLINVITNVLDNSIKYHNNDLKIEVGLTKIGANYCVKITDNGIGMSLKEQKQAFDKFYRAETGDIHNRKGFGLGLSYVKGIVEQHNGTVQIQSQKNSGTTLTLNIPSNHE